MSQLFKLLKKAYKDRDESMAASLVEALFKTNDALVFGTSNNEVFYGHEAIQQLFSDDFKDWNDVLVEDLEAHVEHYGPFTWQSCPARVRYRFEDDEKVYTRFNGIMKDIIKAEKDTRVKAKEITFLLTHILAPRKGKTREYDWMMDLDAIEHEGVLKFLQYSLPQDYSVPDVLLDAHENDEIYFEKEREKIRAIAENKDAPEAVIALIKDTVQEITHAHTVFLHQEEMLTQKSEGFLLVLTSAYFTLSMDDEVRINKVFDAYLHNESAPRDALFQLKRDLIRHDYVHARGREMKIPFRFMGIFQKEASSWRPLKTKITYPFNVILEEKNDYYEKV